MPSVAPTIAVASLSLFSSINPSRSLSIISYASPGLSKYANPMTPVGSPPEPTPLMSQEYDMSISVSKNPISSDASLPIPLSTQYPKATSLRSYCETFAIEYSQKIASRA